MLEKVTDVNDTYEFRIAGRLSHDLLRTFGPSRTELERDATVFVRSIHDEGELFGVIARCETLHLKLVGLRQLAAEPDQDARRGA